MRMFQTLILAASLLSAATARAASPEIEALAMTCNNCHGVNGISVGPSMPSIAGLPEYYLRTVMLQWKTGKRFAATMDRLIKGYSDEQIAALAEYFSKLPWTPVAQDGEEALVARGRSVTRGCNDCHGASGGEPYEPNTPGLNGQLAKYMELELMKCRDTDARVKIPFAKMRSSCRKLDEGDIKAAAAYYAAQSK
jgi:sulfide dehydrogenase cytochrome subunit